MGVELHPIERWPSSDSTGPQSSMRIKQLLRAPWKRRPEEGFRRGPRVLIVLENLPIERDLRVRRECQALVEAGYGVSVICPVGPGGDAMEELAPVVMHRYPAPPEITTKWGFFYEFAYSWAWTARLAVKAMSKEGFDILQACNPPDGYFALALPFKLLGKPFVFDHHDLSPELYAIRFGREHGVLWSLLRLLERASFLTANHVISTNQSFRDVALTRGRKHPEAVTVVRNGPELGRLRGTTPRPELKRGREFLCCWVGIMGAVDDGVDLALHAVSHIVHTRGRRDCQFAFLGDGEAFEEVRKLAERMKLGPVVTFTGWVPADVVGAYLATADIGIQPDPKNARTDLATATKTMEYMAHGLPVVAFDVHETRVSAAEAAVYAEPNDPIALGEAIISLLDDPHRRARMGRLGRDRVEQELAWDHQKRRYVSVFDRMSNRISRDSQRTPGDRPGIRS